MQFFHDKVVSQIKFPEDTRAQRKPNQNNIEKWPESFRVMLDF